MFELLVFLFPAATVSLLAWCGFVLWRRKRRVRQAERNGACLICSTPFAEAQIEYLGEVTTDERAALDRFQARFAVYKIGCMECGAVNICTRDGQAFKARPSG